MENVQLTQRQHETLKIIRSFFDTYGLAPTFKELRRLLGVSSDQAVFDLLEKLKVKGYIRSSKQARSISLTDKANIILGTIIPERTSGRQLESVKSPIELGYRKRLFEKLTEIDPMLGKIYVGGLMILGDKNNPDRIALSAHNFREIVIHLSGKGENLVTEEEEKQIREQRKSINARKLERYLDPRGGVSKITETIYDIFNRKFYGGKGEGFTGIAHHGKFVEPNEYERLVFEFEKFLLKFILPTQPEIYKKIDIILKQNPEKVNSEKLKWLITTNLESYQYFYKYVGSHWLKYLNQNNFLLPNWFVGNYLVRIASEKPNEVMNIIIKYPVDPNNQEIKNTFTLAAINMDPAISSQLVEKINKERWLVPDPKQLFLLQHYINDLLKHLIIGKQYPAALNLASSFLGLLKQEGATRISSIIDDFQFSEALKHIKLIPGDEILPFIYMLLEKLGDVCKLESNGVSYIWLPAIEEHPQNWGSDEPGILLIKAVRDLIQTYIAFLQAQKKKDVRGEILKLLNKESVYPITKRLKLYFYRLYPQIFLEDIKSEVSNSFNDRNVWHEYFVLIKDTFGMLDRKTQQEFFQMIEGGPKKTREVDGKYLRNWKAERIKMAEQHLGPKEKAKYRDLLKIDFKDPDFLAPHYSWSGPNSPFKEEDLATMSIDDLCKRLVSWQPPKDDFGPQPSRYGLGLIFSEVVKKNPLKFIKDIKKFEDPKIHPTYLKYLFYGFREALKSDENLNWSSVISLMYKIIKKMEAKQLPIIEANEDDENWDSNAMSMISFLTTLLGQNNNEYLETQKNKIWFIIKILSEHPDPTLAHEREYGGDNMDPFTMSINTIRGEAFHALFTYMMWCNRLNKGKNKSTELFVPQEVKQVAEEHLKTLTDPSVTIRSVYGRYLPWIIFYDNNWASRVVKDILPEKDKVMRYAAWETYLINAIYPEVYSFMKPYYELAIDELPTQMPQRRYWVDILENLAGHIMIGYIFDIDKAKGPLYKRYFEKANGKQKGVAINFVGRSIVLRDIPAGRKEKAPDIKKMQKFWAWRLKESTNIEELKEFGWWAKEDFFDNQWFLESLLETVRITKGVLEGENWVIKTLSKLSKDYPLLCANILNIIIRPQDPQNYFLSVYEEEIKNTLVNIFRVGNKSAKKIGDQIVDFLTKMGFENIRYIKDNLKPSV